MRQIVARLARVERKLQDLHPRPAGIEHQLQNLRRQEAQILGNERDIRIRLLDGTHQLESGSFDPAPVARGLVDGRDAPIALDAAEMVDAHDVIVASCRADALQPPGKAILLHALPVVDRVAPILPVFAESVGRAAGDAARASGSSELEVFRMCPHVC